MHPCRLECTLIYGAKCLCSSLCHIISLSWQPSTQLRWWDRSWRGLHHSDGSRRWENHLLSPSIFSLIQMGSSFSNPAPIIISQPRTGFGSPNSQLGCHLVLGAESRGSSQVPGAARRKTISTPLPGAAGSS